MGRSALGRFRTYFQIVAPWTNTTSLNPSRLASESSEGRQGIAEIHAFVDIPRAIATDELDERLRPPPRRTNHGHSEGR